MQHQIQRVLQPIFLILPAKFGLKGIHVMRLYILPYWGAQENNALTFLLSLKGSENFSPPHGCELPTILIFLRLNKSDIRRFRSIVLRGP